MGVRDDALAQSARLLNEREAQLDAAQAQVRDLETRLTAALAVKTADRAHTPPPKRQPAPATPGSGRKKGAKDHGEASPARAAEAPAEEQLRDARANEAKLKELYRSALRQIQDASMAAADAKQREDELQAVCIDALERARALQQRVEELEQKGLAVAVR